MHHGVRFPMEWRLHTIPCDGILRLHEDCVLLPRRAQWRRPWGLTITLHQARRGCVRALGRERRGVGSHFHNRLQLLVVQLGCRQLQGCTLPELLRVVHVVDHLDSLRQVVLFQTLQLAFVVLTHAYLLVHAAPVLHSLERHIRQAQRYFGRFLGACGVETNGWHRLEGHLLGIVDVFPIAVLFHRRNTSGLEFPTLLQRCETPRLLELFLPGLPLGLFAPGVGKSRTRLREHFLFILVHVNGVRTCGLGLRVRIDLTRLQATRIVLVHLITSLGLIQKLLVMLQALVCSAADDGSDGAPLRREKFRQVQKFFLFFAGPLCLFHRGVEPFVPTGFALFRALPHK
mmetsp:Transcript_9737/g.25522  ORF Transcript_9737/g.25522 Transcript_9737/m.25522 type:complete len:344 (+) Transcript_9737:1558-2589(+)